MLSEITKAGRYLSIDVDEWTSRNQKRFINISVFSDQEFLSSLGLVHLTGRATAERLMALKISRLPQRRIPSSDAVSSNAFSFRDFSQYQNFYSYSTFRNKNKVIVMPVQKGNK